MPTPPTPPALHPRLERMRALARLMDSAVAVPGTRWRLGLDALIGLVPGVGDAAGALVSGYFVLQAARLGASAATLARMLANVLLEMVIGMIPLLGDLFDATWKANLKNLRLLERHLADPAGAAQASRRWIGAAGVGVVLVTLAIGALAVWMVYWGLGALGG